MVLSGLTTYLSDRKKQLFALFPQKTVETIPTGACSLSITGDELTIVYAEENQGKTHLALCETKKIESKDSLLSLLTIFVKENNLKNIPCSFIMQPEDYQLLLTDAIPVTAAEFQTAIRWKIKDLLRFPLNDVVLDSFNVPKTKVEGQNKIMVVAAQASKLKLIGDQIRESGLDLKNIDIPELSLRNIMAHFEQADQSTALIYLMEKNIQLLITYQKQIYINRTLIINLEKADANTIPAVIERLASEIQRSFDYYQSQWRQPAPTNIMLASSHAIPEEILELLAKNLKNPIKKLNLLDILTSKQSLDLPLQGQYLLNIGGIFRLLSSKQVMLQTINLYTPPQKKPYELTLPHLVPAYIGFSILLLLFYLVGMLQKHDLQNQLNTINNTVATQQQTLNSLSQQYPINDPAELTKAVNQLQQNYENKVLAVDLVSPYANYSKYLLGISAASISSVWLTQIDFNRTEVKIMMKGHAISSAALEEFFDRLTKQPVFSQIHFTLNEIKGEKLPDSFYITGVLINKS